MHTTRQPRPGEVHGEHYFFVNHDEFKEMISRDAFLEHAEVFGNYYGTSREAIQQVLATGVDVFLISTGRAHSELAEKNPARAEYPPPSKIQLDRRLRGRSKNSWKDGHCKAYGASCCGSADSPADLII
ncbi:hypothetical protein ACLK2A_19885 [Escherichia coli]